MTPDLNRKTITRNAYRITSKRGLTCLRIRVPGGHLKARYLRVVQEIAERFGSGDVHITIRQGFEIPGIPFEKMAEVNQALAALVEPLETNIGVSLEKMDQGYPAAGTRNVSACIGNRVCPFANYDTTALAQRVERAVFPNHHHVKIALTGCPNDCIKAHLQDFGIIGQADVQIDSSRCIGCEACEKACRLRVTQAIAMKDGVAVRDETRCIGCGECVLACPTGAWTRNPEKFYRLVILGRTGKKNPRLAAPFVEWTTESAILQILRNTYTFIDAHIDRSLPKEHLGYIVDRVGFAEFKRVVLEGVDLGSKAQVAETVQWAGYTYPQRPGCGTASP
ncbi:MAG TPA: sulfite reductase subunit C [Phycisphaerae bacterium]|jgi:anaerobic sulfite reductase subunit C|nr:sulfite reductase subunit C [Phycisphaerae bacterium]